MFSQHDIGKKYPQITHRHGDGVQLGQLPQHRIRIGYQHLRQNDGAGQDDHHPDAVHIRAVFVLFQQLRRNKLTGVLIVQQHPKRCVDADHQRGKLADGIAGRINDHEQIAHAIVFTQPLKCPVGAVGIVRVKVVCDHRRIKHHPHGNGTEDRTHDHHPCRKDHTSWEAFGRILHLIDIRRNLLTAAHCKYENGQTAKIFPVKDGDQVLQAEIH